MRVLLLFLTLLLAGPASQPVRRQTRFPAGRAGLRTTHDRQADGQMRLYFQIKPGYYLYQKRLKFDGLPSDQQPQLPPALNHHDEFFGDSAVYRDQLELLLPANAHGQLRLGWQGCADAACATRHRPPASTRQRSAGRQASQRPGPGQRPATGHLVWSLLAFFGLGLLLAFTPARCRCCRFSPGWCWATVPAPAAVGCWLGSTY